MPITAYKDYRFTYEPSTRKKKSTTRKKKTSTRKKYKKVTLLDAFQMVVEGKMSAMEVFNQLNKKIQHIINDVSQESFGKDLEHLPYRNQKSVFEMILLSLTIATEGTNPKSSPKGTNSPTRTKKAWQFWK